ncbi:C2 domain containing protein [Nitzschia inconspicua]|uniref:C2 domain containing protein n=1 Tax=Nitzschia inconspicua TaxID=303405 RepID=A0A9K3M1Y9_9STRA|nr:C2 domain containing protein [Nitzschia inconspicua]
MPNLTVELVKVINLRDDSPGVGIADPYVKLDLEQNNRLWNDTNYGRMVSSIKKNERNPVFNETFVFRDIPILKNMELTCTVMDKDDDSRDDKLGKCRFKLDELDLEPIPQVFRKKVDNSLFRKDSFIVLKISYGEKAKDADANKLSYVGKAAYECLRTYYGEYHHSLWNVTTGRIIGELHQTPKNAFPGPGDGTHPDGHDDWFPEIMGEILSRTQVWADVMSLGPPDGRFMTAFQKALNKIAKNAESKDEPVIIRMMFGNIVGMPVNCNAVSRELVKKLSPDANIRLWVGAWRRGVSWNHAKIIAVDGKHLHVGGHNQWDGHYLTFDPVHDLSLEMEGDVAYDGHLFANYQWEYTQSRHESFWGTLGSRMPDSMPQVAKVRVIVSEWPRKIAKEHPPKFTISRVQSVHKRVEQLTGTIPVITMGRYGCLTPPQDRPSDRAFLAMLGSAKKIIHLALQDLGPVCIPGTKIALPGCVWPDEYLSTLAKVIWKRGVDVEIVVSNPGSIPGGLSPTEANYGNGWSCVDVAAEIIKRIRSQFPEANGNDLRAKISDNLRVAFIREGHGNKWADGMNIGMHAKHFIVDDITTYIGSQNLYVCDLAEWGVVIDDAGQTQKFMEEYWNPLWKCSYTGEDVDVDAVMDGLDIDRNGADPNELDDEMKKKMKQAELANAGVGKSGMYEIEEYEVEEC